MSITTNVVNSNPVHGEVYSIHRYVIKFVTDLLQGGGFCPVFSTNNSDRNDRTEMFLKVVLNIIALTLDTIHGNWYTSNNDTFTCTSVIT